MTEAPPGVNAKGIFGNTAPKYSGRRLNYRRKLDSLDRFAELLSQHVDQDDVDSGRVPPGTPLDPGGNAAEAALRMGLMAQSGNGMLQRIRKRLGEQAR